MIVSEQQYIRKRVMELLAQGITLEEARLGIGQHNGFTNRTSIEVQEE